MAKMVVMVIGVVFVLVGLLGFFNDPLLGLFEVDAVHNWVHLLSGLVALGLSWMGESNAKTYAKVFGVIYALVTVLGFVGSGDTLLGVMEINAADNLLHLVLAVVLLWVGFGTSNQSSATTM